ncbi:MAG: DUF4349 domain-containing protein [Spirochaetes bacterium]|nr:DUF4349 domain-containing protein [Spirochaetota bacterium]
MKKKILMVFLSLIIIFINCKAKSYDSFLGESEEKSKIYTGSSDEYNKFDDESNKPSSKDKITTKNAVKDNLEIDRKIIKTGIIGLDVKDLQETEKKLELKIKEYDGYISSSKLYSTTGSIILKIPSENFDAFVQIVVDFGKITNKSVEAQDVTKKYYDIKKRIETKKILQQRYESYLKNASKVDELLSIERELNNVTVEIESMELELKTLSHLVAYSTLTLNLNIPGTNEITRYLPSMKNGFADFGYGFVKFFYSLFFVILYILAFGIPIIIIIALIYFITFGKIGLVKKLFRYFSGKK